jgi:hypothetical protein
MTPLALLTALACAQTVDAPTLEYTKDTFVVRSGRETWRVSPTESGPPPAKDVTFRRNQSFAVWDERGLTIRHGDRSETTQLPAVPTSPRLFPREEIKRTIELLESGERKREASALSGAVRIGPNVYFLIRWEDAQGKPWTEVLVQVDLDRKTLRPEVLGRFSGLSVAFRPVDDRLFYQGDQPAVVTREGNRWGISTFNPVSKELEFRMLGGTLLSFYAINRNEAFFVERTAYGTTIAGRVDLLTGLRRDVYEGRAAARFADTSTPGLLSTSLGDEAWLRSAESGWEVPIAKGAGIRRVGPYALIYRPYSRPTKAQLVRIGDGETLAEWSRR